MQTLPRQRKGLENHNLHPNASFYKNIQQHPLQWQNCLHACRSFIQSRNKNTSIHRLDCTSTCVIYGQLRKIDTKHLDMNGPGKLIAETAQWIKKEMHENINGEVLGKVYCLLITLMHTRQK